MTEQLLGLHRWAPLIDPYSRWIEKQSFHVAMTWCGLLTAGTRAQVEGAVAAGIARIMPPLARASIAAGADGLIIEVHNDPDRALSDGAQSLYPEQFRELVEQIRTIALVLGRTV